MYVIVTYMKYRTDKINAYNAHNISV